jgi:dTDP-glucose pyrophosphorylase
MTNVIITMAGFGRRFLDAGYSIPKYRIEAHGRSLFQWSMLSLRSFIEAGARFVFVVRAADQAAEFIRAEAEKIGLAVSSIVEIDAPTDGQATTAMHAGPVLPDRQAPMLIYNIDTFVHPEALPASATRGSGWIPCFPAAGDHWSFVRTGEDGKAVEVREKVRISGHATVGLYWFDSFGRFEDAYRSHYERSGGVEAGERYVAPLYNHVIETGGAVYVHEIPLSAVIPLGVPREVQDFIAADPPALEITA